MNRTLKHLKALITGYMTIGKNCLKRPVTLFYPEKKKEHKNLRGKVSFSQGDCKCIACGICQSVCPSIGTIAITKQDKKLKELSIDLSQCIQCGNCVENCPTKTLIMTNEYEYSTQNKSDLVIKLRGQ